MHMTRRGQESNRQAIEQDAGLQSLGTPIGEAWDPSDDHAALVAAVQTRIEQSGKSVQTSPRGASYRWDYGGGTWRFACVEETDFTVGDGGTSPMVGTLKSTTVL